MILVKCLFTSGCYNTEKIVLVAALSVLALSEITLMGKSLLLLNLLKVINVRDLSLRQSQGGQHGLNIV